MDNFSAKEILKEKERFEALFEYASMGIVVANEKGIIELANQYLLNLFGYDNVDELLGKEIEMLIPARYSHKHHTHRTKYLKKPERRSMGVGRNLFAIKKNGTEFPVEVSLSHYHSQDGTFVIAFIIDISERKEIENAILQQKEQLFANNLKIEELNNGLENKVEVRTRQLQETLHQLEQSRDELKKALSKEKELGDLKSRFVSMASHEFRTPLSTILSSASLLAKYTESQEQEKRDKHINRIKSSVNNLLDILNEFLSIGRIEDGKILTRYTRFNVQEFVENICNEIRGIAKKEQQFVYIHTGKQEIELDDSLLRNIIFNLMSNAIKFTSDDGIIEVFSSMKNDIFTITIKDNGIGISEEDQQHLFERFFRASNATNIQGTGLGLHIVAKYAELMNGTISFASELEKGTSITISFNKPPQ
ncbi:MAG: PAS domain S-box protein [Ferruginibacter sp.]|jgi:PAS domain S-box-containing protein|nr:PAS domain S-box protein [Ferruginibacter sp.]